ncbi:MAG: hypothetical protein ABI054_03670 [Planctomycetota bacterium]
MRTLLLPLTLALAFALPQEPKVQEPPTPRRPGFAGADVDAARLREEILGAWQLTRGEIPDLGATGSGVAGYALFIDGYMSIEVHVQGHADPDSENTFFQTGTHRWKIDDTSNLETSGLIGTHNITEDEEYDFEPPGIHREYKVKLDGGQLILERSDRKARLTFMRLGKLRFPDGKDGPGVDFYGRPIKPKDQK